MTEQRAVIAVATQPDYRGALTAVHTFAWLNTATGEWGQFIAASGDCIAGAVRMHRQLTDQTLATVTPREVLGDLFAEADQECGFDPGELGTTGPSRPERLRRPWHDVLDVRSYAAGHLGMVLADLPDLTAICGQLDVQPRTGSVSAAERLVECLYRLGAVPRPDEIGGAA